MARRRGSLRDKAAVVFTSESTHTHKLGIHKGKLEVRRKMKPRRVHCCREEKEVIYQKCLFIAACWRGRVRSC